MRASAALFTLVALLGCSPAAEHDAISIGLLLSYTGDLAGSSVNSERALIMAIDAANEAGGVSGQPVAIRARDTRSDRAKVTASARQLLDGGVALFIGPDTRELGIELKDILAQSTVILPSFATADLTHYKPRSWFLMGAAPLRVACELMAEIRADGRRSAAVIADPNGYAYLAFEMTRSYSIPAVVVATKPAGSDASVRQIIALQADALVLAALPPSATSLLYTLAAIGGLGDPKRWYLAPMLHSPVLLETLPKGMLVGARGVSTGTAAGATDFRARFRERWADAPLDDAYPFYDAGAIAALALQRAVARDGKIPAATGLSAHVIAVTHAGGTPVRWNEIGRGLELLRQGQEVGYVGVTGQLEFDLNGQTRAASTTWWTIDESNGFADVSSTSNCR